MDDTVPRPDEPTGEHAPHAHAGAALGHSPLTRRTFLAAVGAAAGTGFVPVTSARAAESSTASLTGGRSVSTAMHVHASWSEGTGSWESQFAQAAQNGVDLLCMTDHDHRALAWKYLPHLKGAEYKTLGGGAASARDASRQVGAIHLLVESAGSAPATAGLQVQPKPQALNRLRTNIGGTVLRHTWGASRFDPGATYEIVIGLSHHEAHGGRPAGELTLRYRFGALAGGSSTADRGRTGVVAAPAPPAGTVTVLRPEDDIARLWPDLLALDNSFLSLTFLVTSPRQGSRAEVAMQDFTFTRTDADAASISRNQRTIIDTYAPRFPGLTARPDVEISQQDPHVNVFGVPQFFPDQTLTQDSNFQDYYVRMVRQVHADGGVVSYNHPFGSNGGPLVNPAAQADKRHAVFGDMWRNNLYGTDILEVGYLVRGQVSLQTHLDLWDTFSRRARFLTGNGVNDDHNGVHWAALGNGFATGIWAGSKADPAVVRALKSGRAFAKHLGNWRNGEVDMLVDGNVPMGKASISAARSRDLAVYVDGLAADGSVELVQGVVDYTGNDPVTFSRDTIPGSAFSTASATVVRSIDTTTSCFVRAVVRNRAGTVIGIGNPVWLLREMPPQGIPAARKA